ncbi:hypothetical protein GC170_12690 [bacterium]|nr:hypothetical protein [bacterium]
MQKHIALFMTIVMGLVSIVSVSAKEPERRKGRGRGEGEVRTASGGGRTVRQNKVQGTVIAVNWTTGQVTIRGRNGSSVTVIATAATKIERNGLHASLTAIQVGDRGQATYDSNFVASKIESVGP